MDVIFFSKSFYEFVPSTFPIKTVKKNLAETEAFSMARRNKKHYWNDWRKKKKNLCGPGGNNHVTLALRDLIHRICYHNAMRHNIFFVFFFVRFVSCSLQSKLCLFFLWYIDTVCMHSKHQPILIANACGQITSIYAN